MSEHDPRAVSDLPHYHGIFAKLARLDVLEQESAGMYDRDFADFWNRYVGHYVGDIPLFERLLPGSGARVLDLACGAGRIGMAMAKNGAYVDGLELSPAMLALVDRNLAGETAQVRERLRFFRGDMACFSLPERYDLVILGTTSISLLPEPAQRQDLFHAVARHLKPGGKFIFDILNLSGERWKKLDHFLDVWSHEDEDGQDFAIVGQRFFPERKCFTFNVFRESIAWNGDTRRSVATSTKAWLEPEDVLAAMAAAGLELVEQFEHDTETFFVAIKPEGGHRD